MGTGIAISLARAGIQVNILENNKTALTRGLEQIQASYSSSVSKSRLSSKQANQQLNSIQGTCIASKLSESDLIIEAAFESMEVKKNVFRHLDKICKDETILATNTSNLNIDEIAEATSRPGRVVGTHFFNPAHIMPLMEIVRGAQTSLETIATVMAFSKQLGKTGVLVKVCDGFVGNRMLYEYRRQAEFLLEEGALPHQVDKALFNFGFPMGPFAMADLTGLDIGWAVRKRKTSRSLERNRYSPILDKLCKMGRFGQKTGAGWYQYEVGNRTPVSDPIVHSLIETVSKERGFARRKINDDEITERCIYALINEGSKIVGEGVVQRASDIDVIWIHGYGFPSYRGGPMYYANTIGLNNIVAFMRQLQEVHGVCTKPSPLLEKLASESKNFDLSS